MPTTEHEIQMYLAGAPVKALRDLQTLVQQEVAHRAKLYYNDHVAITRLNEAEKIQVEAVILEHKLSQAKHKREQCGVKRALYEKKHKTNVRLNICNNVANKLIDFAKKYQ